MKILIFNLLFIAINSHSATLQVNDSDKVNVIGVTSMSCNGITSSYEAISQCCVDGSCSDTSGQAFNQPDNTCPKVVIDGYLYSVQSDISLFHASKTFSINTSSISDCRRPNNSTPTAVSMNDTSLATNDVAIGLSQAYIDVDTWRLIVTSQDGDLLCTGNEAFVDVIFEDGF
ncbi:hypothetical protein [Marinicella sp. W31]|uniref:hypothetical protein n=1 Tax=Marinicella sp. W31 TaxID=3023713 RepID=UPI003757D30C